MVTWDVDTKDSKIKHDIAEILSNGHNVIHEKNIWKSNKRKTTCKPRKKATTIATKKFCVISFFILNTITYH